MARESSVFSKSSSSKGNLEDRPKNWDCDAAAEETVDGGKLIIIGSGESGEWLSNPRPKRIREESIGVSKTKLPDRETGVVGLEDAIGRGVCSMGPEMTSLLSDCEPNVGAERLENRRCRDGRFTLLRGDVVLTGELVESDGIDRLEANVGRGEVSSNVGN